jgi:diguanylate cyclase (GGDEF)-like protein/PAS domain S-box-containing protein
MGRPGGVPDPSRLLDLAGVALVVLSGDGVVVHVSRHAAELLGVRAGALLGSPLDTHVHPDDAVALRATAELLRDGPDGHRSSVAVRVRTADAWRSVRAVAERALDDAQVGGIVVTLHAPGPYAGAGAGEDPATDIDPVTGLATRAVLAERLAAAAAGGRATGGHRSAALLSIDLDRFGVVNDQLGHDVGDRLLREVGTRIRAAVRPGDTVARSGGDEFVVLCERVTDDDVVIRIAHRVELALGEPVAVDGHEIHVAASIRITFTDPSESDPVALLSEAPDPEHRRRPGVRSRWMTFDESLRRRAVERQRLETLLRRSRLGEGLELRYQPVVDLHSGRAVGVEALVRWRVDGREVPPARFIPLAEETGLVVPVGEWVLATACGQLVEWREQHPGWSSLGLSVNVSAHQLQHPDFLVTVTRVLEVTGLPPEVLSVEITESVLIEDVDASSEHLDQLRRMGLRVDLDDFGTGWSSLTYLHRLPVDVVKLDRSFVAGVGSEPEETAIVTAVVDLAAAMGLSCVAEGIETPGQLAELRRLGCSAGQGFLLSPPVAAEDLPGVVGDDLEGLAHLVTTAGPDAPAPGAGRTAT